ncbi:hypothetical protein Ciccas_011261 [Cichlidogyrus casuarinus]|uniref:Uncharacterized protein n=1 Tax=Cichlidogyrus casuarinus TaxID=1844966 RepID=A0ABD2PTE1_9PLAT
MAMQAAMKLPPLPLGHRQYEMETKLRNARSTKPSNPKGSRVKNEHADRFCASNRNGGALKKGQSVSDLSSMISKTGYSSPYNRNPSQMQTPKFKRRGKHNAGSRYGSQRDLSSIRPANPVQVFEFAPKLPPPTINLKRNPINQDAGFIDDELDCFISELHLDGAADEPLFLDDENNEETRINYLVDNGSSSVLNMSELIKKLHDPGMIIDKSRLTAERRRSSASSTGNQFINERATISTLSDRRLKCTKGEDNLFWGMFLSK